MKAESAWCQVKLPRFPRIVRNTAFDVIVIGGGITGLTSAYLLQVQGKKVCLLERNRIGQGDTACTTAHLTAITDLRIGKLVSRFGKKQAQSIWKGGALAINKIEEMSQAEGIECDFRRVPAFLHAPIGSGRREERKFQAEALQAAELGLPASYVESTPIAAKPGICFANQAKFHPQKFLAGLAKAFTEKGGEIFEKSEVTEFIEKPRAVKANGMTIEGEFLVIATHVPLMGLTGAISAAYFQTKLAPYSSYVVGAKLPRNQFPESLLWDTSDPYYYLRIDRGSKNDYAIFGGEDHKTGQVTQTEEKFEALQEKLRELLPSAKPDRTWSGQVIETNDGLPYIGETAERQFVATGFSGNGMTFGVLAAMMAADAAEGTSNPWKELFQVGRKKFLGGTLSWVKENLDYPYYYVRDTLLKPDAKTAREVKGGEGRILKIENEWIACARQEDGELKQVSAVCTHLGCIVHWNSAEKTWDCPCHGSRFETSGEVRSGPAEKPLEVYGVAKGKEAAAQGRKSHSKSPLPTAQKKSRRGVSPAPSKSKLR